MLYDVEAVLIAVGITTGIVLALTVFAFQVSDLEFIVLSNRDTHYIEALYNLHLFILADYV